jgi:nicotinate phosphoribosyltransferase
MPQVKVYAIAEGTVVFPRVPLLRIEGPLAVVQVSHAAAARHLRQSMQRLRHRAPPQLMETTLLNCVNYPSLVSGAPRGRVAAPSVSGARRSQPTRRGTASLPDLPRSCWSSAFAALRAPMVCAPCQPPLIARAGAMAASRYTYIGGFDGTSNVAAGLLHGIMIKGTHAHSFVLSFTSLKEIKSPK